MLWMLWLQMPRSRLRVNRIEVVFLNSFSSLFRGLF